MSQTVYISKAARENDRDSKYHHTEDCSVSGDPNRFTLPEREAVEREYDPCLNCVGAPREARLETLQAPESEDDAPGDTATTEDATDAWPSDSDEADFDMDLAPRTLLAVGGGLLLVVVLWQLLGLWFVVLLAVLAGALYVSY